MESKGQERAKGMRQRQCQMRTTTTNNTANKERRRTFFVCLVGASVEMDCPPSCFDLLRESREGFLVRVGVWCVLVASGLPP